MIMCDHSHWQYFIMVPEMYNRDEKVILKVERKEGQKQTSANCVLVCLIELRTGNNRHLRQIKL